VGVPSRVSRLIGAMNNICGPQAEQDEIRVERRDRLGGLVHEYVLAA
jgi:hypothetical protein